MDTQPKCINIDNVLCDNVRGMAKPVSLVHSARIPRRILDNLSVPVAYRFAQSRKKLAYIDGKYVIVEPGIRVDFGEMPRAIIANLNSFCVLTDTQACYVVRENGTFEYLARAKMARIVHALNTGYVVHYRDQMARYTDTYRASRNYLVPHRIATIYLQNYNVAYLTAGRNIYHGGMLMPYCTPIHKAAITDEKLIVVLQNGWVYVNANRIEVPVDEDPEMILTTPKDYLIVMQSGRVYHEDDDYSMVQLPWLSYANVKTTYTSAYDFVFHMGDGSLYLAGLGITPLYLKEAGYGTQYVVTNNLSFAALQADGRVFCFGRDAGGRNAKGVMGYLDLEGVGCVQAFGATFVATVHCLNRIDDDTRVEPWNDATNTHSYIWGGSCNTIEMHQALVNSELLVAVGYNRQTDQHAYLFEDGSLYDYTFATRKHYARVPPEFVFDSAAVYVTDIDVVVHTMVFSNPNYREPCPVAVHEDTQGEYDIDNALPVGDREILSKEEDKATPVQTLEPLTQAEVEEDADADYGSEFLTTLPAAFVSSGGTNVSTVGSTTTTVSSEGTGVLDEPVVDPVTGGLDDEYTLDMKGRRGGASPAGSNFAVGVVLGVALVGMMHILNRR